MLLLDTVLTWDVLTYPLDTAHTSNMILSDQNKRHSTRAKCKLQMLSYYELWNLLVTLSSTAVRTSVFYQERRAEISLIHLWHAIFFDVCSKSHDTKSDCSERENKNTQFW